MKIIFLTLLLLGCEAENIRLCHYMCEPNGAKSYSKTNGCECIAPLDAGK